MSIVTGSVYKPIFDWLLHNNPILAKNFLRITKKLYHHVSYIEKQHLCERLSSLIFNYTTKPILSLPINCMLQKTQLLPLTQRYNYFQLQFSNGLVINIICDGELYEKNINAKIC